MVSYACTSSLQKLAGLAPKYQHQLRTWFMTNAASLSIAKHKTQAHTHTHTHTRTHTHTHMPVLILVGMMMMSESANINWTHIPSALPAFLTIMIQPFTFSVANGIYAGMCKTIVQSVFPVFSL